MRYGHILKIRTIETDSRHVVDFKEGSTNTKAAKLAYGVYVCYSHWILAPDSSSSVLMHAVCGLAADPSKSLKHEAKIC